MDTEVKFADEFKRYWKAKGRYLSTNNSGRTMDHICSWLEKCESVEDIEKHVCTMKNKKESTRRIIVDFLDYLENRIDIDCNTSLSKKRFFDYVIERRLEIAKYLHEPHTSSEIGNRFNISKDIVKKDLQALREGIEVFGTTIELDEQRKGRKKYYRTTMHPVFLPLNLTEAYAMTVYLGKLLSRNDPNTIVVQSVINRIKAQLSDYAWDKLFDQKKPKDLENYYISDERLAESREGIRMYLEKSGEPCKFFYKGESYYGRIDRHGRIQLSNGEYLDADPKHVEFIIENLKYK